MAKAATKKPVVYPGELGKHGQIGQLVLSEVFKGPYAWGTPDIEAHALQLTSDHQFRMLDLLADHYGIADDNVLMRHAFLALRLAQDHVPAFQYGTKAKRGRPPKMFPNLLSLRGRGLGLSGAKAETKRGRRKDPGRDGYLKGLLEWVLEICEDNGYRGHGAITKALDIVISETARKSGVSVASMRRKSLASLRKDTSEAKNKFPEIAAKFAP